MPGPGRPEIEGDAFALPSFPSGEPRWVEEAARRLIHPFRPFLATAGQFLRHPAKFSARWVQGERFALNPASFVATGVAALTVLERALQPLLKTEQHETFLQSAVRAVAPTIHFALLGVGAHFALRLMGSRRRISSSVGIALYAGGTVGLFLQGFTYAALGAMSWLNASPAVQQAVAFFSVTLFFGLFFTYLGTALGGAHGVGSLKMFAANAVALLLASIVLGVLPLPTLHLVVELWRGGHYAPGISLELGI